MERVISCCGAVCSDCNLFPGDCKGCPEITGKVYWLAYTGEEACAVYHCCKNIKRLMHCGTCPEMPCALMLRDDPTKTPEENAADHRKQLDVLQSL